MRCKRPQELCVSMSKCIFCGKKKRLHQLPHSREKKCASPDNCDDISAKLRKPRRNTAFKAISKKRRERQRKRKTKAELALEREELLKQVAIMKNENPANRKAFMGIILREMERLGRQPARKLKMAAENAMESSKKATPVQSTPNSQDNILPQSSGPCQVCPEKSQKKISKETMTKKQKRIDLKSKKISKNVANNISHFEKLLKEKKSSTSLSGRKSISFIMLSPKPSESSLETHSRSREDSQNPISTVLSPKPSSLDTASQEPSVRSTFYLYPMQNTEDFITVEETRGEEGMETIFEAHPSSKAMEDFLEFLKGAFLLSQQSKRNFRINLK